MFNLQVNNSISVLNYIIVVRHNNYCYALIVKFLKNP